VKTINHTLFVVRVHKVVLKFATRLRGPISPKNVLCDYIFNLFTIECCTICAASIVYRSWHVLSEYKVETRPWFLLIPDLQNAVIEMATVVIVVK